MRTVLLHFDYFGIGESLGSCKAFMNVRTAAIGKRMKFGYEKLRHLGLPKIKPMLRA